MWNKYSETLQLKSVQALEDYGIILDYFKFYIENRLSIKDKSIFIELKEEII